MRVALVHDYLNQLGGAERVFQEIASLFPHASIYTLFADAGLARRLLPGRVVHTTILDRLPGISRRHSYALWLMPWAVERFDFSRFDLVISSSSSFAKGVLTGPETLHISYVATPLRYVWDDYHRDRHEFPLFPLVRSFVPFATHYVRLWDLSAAERPDRVLTISEYSRVRIKKYYGRDATVIYPPVDVRRFQSRTTNYQLPTTNYFLMVGRLTPYKRFDLAVEAFNELGLPLWVVGDGPQRKILEARARSNIRFLGWAGEERLAGLYAGADAFIFPQEEHFGLVAVEAMAAGTPVIAYGGGGALEIIRAGVGGTFFHEQTPAALVETVRNFRKSDFDPAVIQAEAARFDREVFRQRFLDFISTAINSKFQAPTIKQIPNSSYQNSKPV